MILRERKKIYVLTGAGMSAESGIMTFRDMGGLWQQYNIEEVASPVAWRNNQELVLRFYNQRRKQLMECQPNDGHLILAQLEKHFDITIVTQNVDNLHERAGSTSVLHLHGELMKARSTGNPGYITTLDYWELKSGDLCPEGFQLRPHIVWFGEDVPEFTNACQLMEGADIVVVVGTSLSVYPAAGLMRYIPQNAAVYLIDPVCPAGIDTTVVHHIAMPASAGIKKLSEILLQHI